LSTEAPGLEQRRVVAAFGEIKQHGDVVVAGDRLVSGGAPLRRVAL